MSHVIGFNEERATDSACVGGKASSLGRLVAAGFRVPPGFSVSTQAHSEFLTTSGLAERIHHLIAGLNFDDPADLEARTAEIRSLIVTTDIPPAIAEAIVSAYEGLGGTPNVAVRSSGTAEDLAQASFAGMYDTYLDIVGPTDVLDAVRRWRDRAARGGGAADGVTEHCRRDVYRQSDDHAHR
jgi:rifampicin phosphotransferase